jgi:hypothetical protein
VSKSLEGVLHVEVKLADALANVVERSMGVLFFVEQLRVHGVDYYFN